MAEAAVTNSVQVRAADDMLVRVLNQHAGNWRAVPFADPPTGRALVIVDLDAVADQQDFVAGLRGAGFAGPALILGGREATTPEDEPISRPVRLGILLARIEAHWAEAGESGLLRLGPYEFVPSEQLLRLPESETVIRLTELERKLLLHLALADGAAIDRDTLLAQVWGYSAGVDTHTVETHIWRLRQKIETDDPSSRFLVTEAGKYRLLLAAVGQGG